MNSIVKACFFLVAIGLVQAQYNEVRNRFANIGSPPAPPRGGYNIHGEKWGGDPWSIQGNVHHNFDNGLSAAAKANSPDGGRHWGVGGDLGYKTEVGKDATIGVNAGIQRHPNGKTEQTYGFGYEKKF